MRKIHRHKAIHRHRQTMLKTLENTVIHRDNLLINNKLIENFSRTDCDFMKSKK